MAKLLLISPGNLYAPTWGYCPHKGHMHLLYSHIMSVLPSMEVTHLDFDNLFGCPTCDTEVETFKMKAQALLEKTPFDIVGISCWTSLNYMASVWVAKVCKKINPKCTVVVGGYHATAVPGDFDYLFSPFDFVVKNEGERFLEKICRGDLQKTRKVQILDETESCLDPELRLHSKFPFPDETFGIYLSRGCPYGCGYCMEGCKGRAWKPYTVKESLEFLDHVVETWHPKKIAFNDSCFGVNPKWRREFLKELVARDYDINYWAETRIDCMDDETLDHLTELDFHIDFGIDSCSEEMLMIMNKTNNPKKYLEQLELYSKQMDERQIRHNIFMLYNHPGETSKTAQESVDWLWNFIKSKKETYTLILASRYAYFPGSEIYYNFKYYAKTYGTKVKHPEWWKEKGDQFKISRHILPSQELMDTDKIFFYEQELDKLYIENFDRMAPDYQKKVKDGKFSSV